MALSDNAQQRNDAEADALLDALGRLRAHRGRGNRGGMGGPDGRHWAGVGGGSEPGFGPDFARMGRGARGGHLGGPIASDHPEFEAHWREAREQIAGEYGEPSHDDAHGPRAHGPRGRGSRTGGAALLRLLGTLAHSPEPLSISELAERIGVDQPRASRLVQQAVAHGHAVREADPADARRSRVRITEQGERFVHGVRGRQRDEASTALAALSEGERADLLRLLAKLADAWPVGE